MRHCLRFIFVFSIVLLTTAGSKAATPDYTIKLVTGEISPEIMRNIPKSAASLEGKHILIQFNGPITASHKHQLAQDGIELLDYIPNFSYTARLTGPVTQEVMDEHQIRWFGDLQSKHKLSPLITEVGIGDWARRGGDRVQFAVVVHTDEEVDMWAGKFERDYGADIIGTVPSSGIIDLIIDEMMYFRLSELDAVMWIEPAMREPEEHNNSARVNTGAEELQELPWGLTGTGVVVAEWDGGRADASHTDLGVRRIHSLDGSTLTSHATHVAGTVLGTGEASGGLYRGMAPDAELLTQLWWGTSSEIQSEYSTTINSWGAAIATNSWGYGVGDPATQSACENTLGNYYSVNRTIDDIVRGSAGAPITICWSAGNQRSGGSSSCGSLGWTYGTIGAISSAKNIITVGAIKSNDNSMTTFSSWGPTDDGRIKPDVVGPGYQLTSCEVGSGYTTKSGTSMSTPAVAGTIALLHELWNNQADTSILLASSIKGILINSAEDLGRPGPDYEFGHGKVDGVAAARKIAIGLPSFVQGEVSTDDVAVYNLTISGSVENLKVTLVWDDAGGTVSSSQTLKNDLDLVLIDPFEVEKSPWKLNPNKPNVQAVRGSDHLNNVETVEVSDPTAGLWKAVVSGFNIPEGPQKYSLVFSPDSIHTPESFAAVAAYGGVDVEGDPGDSTTVEFWVSNVGASADSMQVTIEDDILWLSTTIDTVVHLEPYDSVHFVVSVNIPPGSSAGDHSNVSCNVASLTTPQATDHVVVMASAAAVYALEISGPSDDTVGSPDTYFFDVTVTNLGNGADEIEVRPYDELGWQFSPWLHTISLAVGADTVVTFSVSIPAEVAHETINSIAVTGNSSGDFSDTTNFGLMVSNSIFPPSLKSPDAVVFTQERIHTFEWTSDIATSFTVLIATDTLMTETVKSYVDITDTSFIMPVEDSLSDGTYFWAVRRFVNGDSSSLQLTPRQIVVDNIPPVDVVSDSLINPDYVNDKLFILLFEIADGKDPNTLAPELSQVQLSQDSTFAAAPMEFDSIDGFSHQQTDTLPEGRWYWRALRFDLAGNYSDFSELATFVLDTEAPPVPTLMLPENNVMIYADSILIAWGTDEPASHDESPERYYLHVSDRDDFGDFNTFQGYVYDTLKVLPDSLLELGKTYYWRARAFDSAGLSSEYSLPFSFWFNSFICGDVDGNGEGPDLGDLTFLITYLFIDGPAPEPFEAGIMDGDDAIDLSDLTYLIDYLFIDGPPPDCN
jgi:hypothetical protein